MFLTEADNALTVSFSRTTSAQETGEHVFPSDKERVRKLIQRLHVVGNHVSKTSLGLLLQRRDCPAPGEVHGLTSDLET